MVVPIADNEISLRVPRTNERRPDPRYTSNLIVSNDAKSWYDGIQIEWVKRLGDGLQITTSYTRSRSLDTTSEATFVGAGDSNQQGPNAAYAKGYSRFHTPHRFSFNSTYLLPFMRDRRDLLGYVLGGWQVSGVVRLTSGTPFTVIADGPRPGLRRVCRRPAGPAGSVDPGPEDQRSRHVAGPAADQRLPAVCRRRLAGLGRRPQHVLRRRSADDGLGPVQEL